MKYLAVGMAAILLFAGCASKSEPPPAADAGSTVTASPAASTATPTATPTAAKKPPKSLASHLAFLWPPNWFEMLFPKKPTPPQAEPAQLIGVVKMVNTADRFLLIDAVNYRGTPAGSSFVCIRDEATTANLRMGALRNPPFLIADIVSGAPLPGDRVYKR